MNELYPKFGSDIETDDATFVPEKYERYFFSHDEIFFRESSLALGLT